MFRQFLRGSEVNTAIMPHAKRRQSNHPSNEPTEKQQMQKYAVNQQLIETLLAWVNSGEIAIPERPQQQ
jgi:hypothetical protein